MIRAAIYGRVSTASQVSTDPWASLGKQMEDLRGLAERFGAHVVLAVEEQGSGAKSDRPGWVSVLAACRAGGVDVIMAVAFDRLTRSEKLGDFESLKVELRALGVRLVTLKQGEVNLSGSADAEMLTDVQAVWSKGERLKIRERTMSGKARKGLAGGWTGYHPPYGYATLFHPTTGERMFELDPERAPVVRRIFAEFGAGKTLTAIARGLLDDGIPGPEGGHWHISSVRNILGHPNYVGMAAWKRKRSPSFVVTPSLDFPAVVDQSAWQEAQANLALLSVRSPRGHYKPYPLSGILRCTGCGSSLTAHHNATASYYRCSNSKENKAPCTAPQMLNMAVCHATVLDYLRAALAASLDEGRRKKIAAREKPATIEDITAIRLSKKLGHLEAKRSKLIDWAMSVDLEKDALDMKLRELREDIETTRARLLEAQKVEAVTVTARATSSDLKPLIKILDAIDEKDATDLRDFFDAAILEVSLLQTVRGKGIRQRLEVEHLRLRAGTWV
jgi:site-specific DNA recombinase